MALTNSTIFPTNPGYTLTTNTSNAGNQTFIGYNQTLGATESEVILIGRELHITLNNKFEVLYDYFGQNQNVIIYNNNGVARFIYFNTKFGIATINGHAVNQSIFINALDKATEDDKCSIDVPVLSMREVIELMHTNKN